MSSVTPSSDRAEALAFIARMQSDPTSAIGYVDTLEDGLEGDLDLIEQPWLETLRVCRDAAGALTGAVLVEWDTEVGMCWVHGPWTTRETWDTDALPLLRAAVEQADVARHEVYAPLTNTRLAGLAVGLGWTSGRVNFVYRGPRENIAAPDPGVRLATPADYAAVYRLHSQTFPSTYATAEQLVDPQSKYTTLVCEADGRIVGYVTGRPDGDVAYIDFVGVAPDARGQGHGRRLLRAAADALPGSSVRLAVSEHALPAIRLFESLGMTQQSATRGFRSQDPSWLVRSTPVPVRLQRPITDRIGGAHGL